MQKKKIIYFGTSSTNKYCHYRHIFNSYDIELIRANQSVDMIEPQVENEYDAHEFIVSHPLKLSARFVIKNNSVPFLIEDTMLFISAISKDIHKGIGLPGADTKNWWKNLGNEGVLKILSLYNNRSAIITCTIGLLIEKNDYYYESFSLEGAISNEIRESKIATEQTPRTNPYFFHKIFIPTGCTNTMAEMDYLQFKEFDYRRECVRKLMLRVYAKIEHRQIPYKQLRIFHD